MKVDMSSRAVTIRLQQTSELRRLCLSLGKNQMLKALRDNLEKNVSTVRLTPKK
jgi:hypothetical protein